MPQGATVVLVVEDEPAIRSLFRMALTKEGYFVLEAANGAEALEVLDRAGRADIIVTDIVMPVMTGTELAKRIRANRPEIKILFISSYAVDDTGPNVHLLQKPFNRDVLVKRVREVVGPPAPFDAAGDIPMR